MFKLLNLFLDIMLMMKTILMMTMYDVNEDEEDDLVKDEDDNV